MKLSIVIPIYNLGDHILRTLESLINQPKEHFEIILVNDGSTDSSPILAEKFLKEKKFKNYKLINKTNGGVSSARNIGISQSKGEYILFLDGDDYVSPDFVKSVIPIINQNKFDLICWGYNSVDLNKNVNTEFFEKYKPNFEKIEGIELLKKIIVDKEFWIWTASALYRKEFLIKNNLLYTEGCINGEDIEFSYMALFYAKNIFFINKVLSYYVIREGSISNSFKIRKFDSVISMMRCYEKFKLLDNEIVNLISTEILENNIIDNYYTNIYLAFKYSKYKKLSKLIDDIEFEYPGLNKKMLSINNKMTSTKRYLKIKRKFFLFAPNLYLKISKLINK